MIRHFFAGGAILAATIAAGAATAQDESYTPEQPECIAPAAAGGGWDFTCRQVARVLRETGLIDGSMRVQNRAGGGEAISQLLAGSLQAYSGDLSEAMGFVESGDLRVLAVLAPERLDGDFSEFPTAREQGLDVIGANWRGFYAPGEMSDAAYDWWAATLEEMYQTEAWQSVMESNGLADLSLYGADFEEFVRDSVGEIEQISQEIGLIN